MTPEVVRRRVECRIEQRRRDEQRQSQLRLDHDVLRERQEGKPGAGERKERGIGDLEPPGYAGKKHGDEQERDRPFEQGHA